MGTAVTGRLRGFTTGVLRLVLKPVWRLWLRFAKAFARVNTFLLMAVSFFGLVFPISLLRRLGRTADSGPAWLKREPLPPDHFRKQY